MNIENRTVYCNDNLNILKGINNDTIDLIYLDPPFNSGKDYGGARKSMAASAEFKDKWDEDDFNIEWWFDIKNKHEKLYQYLSTVDDFSSVSHQVYLTMMAIRILEMYRILKSTGTLYYHCDHSMSHYIKIMLDIVFGHNNFRNHIVWCYGIGGTPKKDFPRKHDDIFRYTKSKIWTFNPKADLLRIPYKEGSLKMHFKHTDENGRVYRQNKNGRKYADEGQLVKDWWVDVDQTSTNPFHKEYTGYPTQKPLKLLKRIIAASSNEGDMILDPFCGCATACVAAEHLNRRWIGIDVWEGAHKLIKERLVKEVANIGDSDLFNDKIDIHLKSKAPKRTDNDPAPIKLKKRKYVSDEIKEAVYERDNGACKSCGSKEQLQYDHIIPFSKGGSDEIDNLQILCRSCNLTKSNKYHS